MKARTLALLCALKDLQMVRDAIDAGANEEAVMRMDMSLRGFYSCNLVGHYGGEEVRKWYENLMRPEEFGGLVDNGLWADVDLRQAQSWVYYALGVSPDWNGIKTFNKTFSMREGLLSLAAAISETEE